MAEKLPSPFYTGKPLPPSQFLGRTAQMNIILNEGASPVSQGKPIAMFVQGEYGIGKTSLALFAQRLASNKYDLHPIRCNMAGAKDLNDVARVILQGTLDSGAMDTSKTPDRAQAVFNWIGKSFTKVNIFGIAELDPKALREEAPSLADAFKMQAFFRELWKRLRDAGGKGIFLILDELNGIASNPYFAHFIKSIVDANVGDEPVPLFLMLVGTPERRSEMVVAHTPINRIFRIIDVQPLTNEETSAFYERAFSGANMIIERPALNLFVKYTKGSAYIPSGDWRCGILY